MDKKLVLHLGNSVRGKCPMCVSRLAKAGFRVTDSAGVTAFVCRGHLIELGEVCRLETQAGTASPGFDYFAVPGYEYGYIV